MGNDALYRAGKLLRESLQLLLLKLRSVYIQGNLFILILGIIGKFFLRRIVLEFYVVGHLDRIEPLQLF